MNAPLTLDPDEKIILKAHRHWIVFALAALRIIIVALIPFVLFAYLKSTSVIPPEILATSVFSFLGVWWLIIAWCALGIVWTDYYLDIWILTDRRVINIEQIALFDRNISTWGIERIQEVTVHVENVVQTFLNYGELQIQTAGPTDEYARAIGLPDPEGVRAAILSQVTHVGELEETNAKQEKLIHAVSHEVKSYLTKDVAALETIAESVPEGNVPVREFAHRALHETRQGVEAVMNILQSSDPKTGEMAVEHKIFDIVPMISALADEFTPMATDKNLVLEKSIAKSPVNIRGDEMKMRDLVFRNILDNAVRYTQAGSVKIEVVKKRKYVYVTVSDSGVGISKEDMMKLFTEGGRGSHSTEVNPDSTGYGLAAAKRIVDAHDGEIEALSEGEGKGAKFIVTLPLAV